ncbi:hypothetical protein Nepgr_005215 [Nepenthes gracilis]|uniref:Uncharacterized protein n=1 Tax=Nepenthes gracilis TaxID=150966 RepID=A0AAD3XGD3_NEPGR|nr:hypothetical protein Nepgr_005215 [Nepenthes gracilis]
MVIAMAVRKLLVPSTAFLPKDHSVGALRYCVRRYWWRHVDLGLLGCWMMLLMLLTSYFASVVIVPLGMITFFSTLLELSGC